MTTWRVNCQTIGACMVFNLSALLILRSTHEAPPLLTPLCSVRFIPKPRGLNRASMCSQVATSEFSVAWNNMRYVAQDLSLEMTIVYMMKRFMTCLVEPTCYAASQGHATASLPCRCLVAIYCTFSLWGLCPKHNTNHLVVWDKYFFIKISNPIQLFRGCLVGLLPDFSSSCSRWALPNFFFGEAIFQWKIEKREPWRALSNTALLSQVLPQVYMASLFYTKKVLQACLQNLCHRNLVSLVWKIFVFVATHNEEDLDTYF